MNVFLVPKYPPKTIKEAESKGLVADSLEVRKNLLEQVQSGLITLESCQKQLKKIQKTAHENGLYTREDIARGRLIDFVEAKKEAVEKNKKKLEKNLNKNSSHKVVIKHKI